MKFLTTILILTVAVGCQESQPMTYEEGLENCVKMQADGQKPHPAALTFPNPNCIVGAQIPDFEAITLDGKKINRESLKGKASIINFWFTTCAPCVAEIPGFNAIVEKYGPNTLNYVAIGRDDRQEITEFLSSHTWRFDQIPDGNEIIRNNFKLQLGFPTTFVLDKNAIITQVFCGGKTDSTAVEAIQINLIPVIEKAMQN